MKDFGNIVYYTDTKVYIINNGLYAVPNPEDSTVPKEIHAAFDALYAEIDEYAKANPDKVINKTSYEFTPEEIEAQELAEAQAQSEVFMSRKISSMFAQKAAFTSTEFAMMAKAKLFESWKAGETYSAGYRLEHKGIVYEVVQEVVSIENQPPDTPGMLAIYRPLSVDSETGEAPDGTKEHPYAYLHGMDVKKDSYYTFKEKLWLAKADMPACIWDPGTEGLWQWEEASIE